MISWITSPVLLMSFCVSLGLFFGNIKFGKFRFSTSGSMFVGIVVGWAITKYIHTIKPSSELYSSVQSILAKDIVDKDFFDLFLILFIASVGLLAAKEVGKVIKKYGIKFICLGFLITSIGAVTTYGVSLVSSIGNPYLYTGAYTGALTSSPGLAASLETARSHFSDLMDHYDQLSHPEKQKILDMIQHNENSEIDNDIEGLSEEQKKDLIRNVEAGVGTGYAVSYPFGVIIVIFAMNFFPIIFKIDTDREKLLLAEELKDNRKESQVQIGKDNQRVRNVFFDLSAYALVCLIGYFISIIQIPLGSFGKLSLGSTGGVLIAALILGHIGNIGPFCFRMNNQVLSVIRTITLAYFFASIGIRYGYRVIHSLTGPGFTLVIASIFIGSLPMLIGFLAGRYLFKINWVMLSGAICGGMTSTPGLGAAIDAIGSEEPAAGYGAVYPFALIGMVLFSIILNRIV